MRSIYEDIKLTKEVISEELSDKEASKLSDAIIDIKEVIKSGSFIDMDGFKDDIAAIPLKFSKGFNKTINNASKVIKQGQIANAYDDLVDMVDNVNNEVFFSELLDRFVADVNASLKNELAKRLNAFLKAAQGERRTITTKGGKNVLLTPEQYQQIFGD